MLTLCREALAKFEGGLNLLHEADDVIWLESTATAALYSTAIVIT